MKHRRFFIGSMLLFTVFAVKGQTFISPQQELTFSGFADRLEIKGAKKVVIDGNDFSIEIPDGGVLTGRLELIQEIARDTEQRKIYELSGGGILSVIDDEDDTYDHVFVNLMGTSHKKTITYWLIEANRGDD